MMIFEGTELVGFCFKAFIIIVLSGIIVLPLVSVRLKHLFSIVFVSLIALVTSIPALNALTVNSLEYIINGGAFFGEIPVRIDPLSAWFILIINFTSFTGILYGSGYVKWKDNTASIISYHWILYIIFQASMLAVCMVQHCIVFIVAWEFMSLSSFLLVMFDHTNPAVLKSGVNYLVQMHISVILLTVAFIWVYVATGSFDLNAVGTFFGSNTNIWLFLIFFAGFGIKAGFIGLHTWLPEAHPAAPSHVSGVMSGVIVKMGIYGIFRILTFLRSDFLILGNIIISISVLTGIFGIINSAVRRDFKQMLAYCTIENIGIIGIGIGLGMTGIARNQNLLVIFGFGGALLHVLNHSLYKSLLFYSAGSVYSMTHTRDMDHLGGLIRKMPATAILFLAGAIAIGGMPPFNGFISEFLIYSGILHGFSSEGISEITLMILSFAGLSLIGGISVITFTKTFGTVFLGNERKKLVHEPTEVSNIMLFPQYLIVISMLIIGIFPGTFISVTTRIIGSCFYGGMKPDLAALNSYLTVMQSVSYCSLLLLLLIGLVFFIRWILSRNNEKVSSATWGCGYVAPNNRMQYTGKSFSKSFGKLLNFTMIEKKESVEIGKDDLFPVKGKYTSHYIDIFDTKIIDPLMKIITRFIDLFQFIQNGRIQAYVIYGIVFILAIFIGTILNLIH